MTIELVEHPIRLSLLQYISYCFICLPKHLFQLQDIIFSAKSAWSLSQIRQGRRFRSQKNLETSRPRRWDSECGAETRPISSSCGPCGPLKSSVPSSLPKRFLSKAGCTCSTPKMWSGERPSRKGSRHVEGLLGVSSPRFTGGFFSSVLQGLTNF